MKLTPIQKKFVSNNRSNPTPSEHLMCEKLKSANIKYVSQYVLPYKDSFIICDFMIPYHGVIIEVDGQYHCTEEQGEKDYERDIYLRSIGFTVIRMWNSEVKKFDANKIKCIKMKKHSLKPKEEPKKKPKKQKKYTLAQKAEDKKKLTPSEFRRKYPKQPKR